MHMMKPYKVVAKAIIFDQNRVLILRKSLQERLAKDSHGWDFPGGTLEPDESLMDGLSRELQEEVSLSVKVVAPAYIYDEIQEEKHMMIIKFACHQPSGEVMISEEHDSYHWFDLDSLHQATIPEWMKEEIRRAQRVYKEFQK